MQLTREQAIAEHRKMWNWIADETLKRKEIVDKHDYFKENCPDLYNRISHLCYCCEYVSNRLKTEVCSKKDCNGCPINFGTSCFDVTGRNLFRQWSDIVDNGPYSSYRKAADLARQIANLPENEEKPTIELEENFERIG